MDPLVRSTLIDFFLRVGIFLILIAVTLFVVALVIKLTPSRPSWVEEIEIRGGELMAGYRNNEPQGWPTVPEGAVEINPVGGLLLAPKDGLYLIIGESDKPARMFLMPEGEK